MYWISKRNASRYSVLKFSAIAMMMVNFVKRRVYAMRSLQLRFIFGWSTSPYEIFHMLFYYYLPTLYWDVCWLQTIVFTNTFYTQKIISKTSQLFGIVCYITWSTRPCVASVSIYLGKITKLRLTLTLIALSRVCAFFLRTYLIRKAGFKASKFLRLFN